MQQAVKSLWLGVSITFMIIAISFFMPLAGEISKAFTYTGNEKTPYVEMTNIPIPVGVSSAEVIASLHNISLIDYSIEVRQGESSYIFSNDTHFSKYVSNINRNRIYAKEIQRDIEGKIQKVIYTEQ